MSSPAHIVRVSELEIDLAAWRVKRGSCVIELAPLEFRLLACLAEHIGQVVSYDKLLDEVWRYAPDAGGTLEQVRTCVKRLRQKIEPDPHHPQHIINIKKAGYRLRNQTQWEEATLSS